MAANFKNDDKLRGILYIQSKDGKEEPVKLRRDSTIFGREKGDILIDDHEISSTHFQIQNINGEYHIFDMNSTNGTFVNKKRTVRSPLANNDIITAGQIVFRFSLEKEGQTRNMATVYPQSQYNRKENSDFRTSVVDTLVEHELANKNKWGIRIYVTYHTGLSEVIDLSEDSAFIGRASSFGSFDKDTEMSRKHMKIKLNNYGEVFIEDLESTNGSFLNGAAIKGIHPVTPKDNIKVGSSIMRIKAIKK